VADLKWIGFEVFAGVSLKRLLLPRTIEVIDKLAFDGCYDFSHIQFVGPEGRIGLHIMEKAFQGCVSLPEVVFPSSLSVIRDYSFAGCTHLRTVNFGSDGSDQYLGIHSFSRSPLAFVTFSSSLAVIEAFCFERTSIAVIEILSLVELIAERAFIRCQKLRTVTFGAMSALAEIQSEAFAECSLHEIKIPRSVKTIGYQAFY
jgi:hypothetical protein